MDEIDDSNCMYFVNDKVIIFCRSPPNEAVEQVIHEKLQPATLYRVHDPVLMGHPGGWRKYDMMRRS